MKKAQELPGLFYNNTKNAHIHKYRVLKKAQVALVQCITNIFKITI